MIENKLLKNFDEAAEIIAKGGVGVIPTDTIYGIVGSALSTEAVERVRRIKKRPGHKPCIVLISDIKDLASFDISVDDKHLEFLKKIWPNNISVEFGNNSKRLLYLHRDQGYFALRNPKNSQLIEFLKKAGPVIAPSANISGETPATTIKEAISYFGDGVDFYVDGGRIMGEPSTLIKINDRNKVEVIRSGAFGEEELKRV